MNDWPVRHLTWLALALPLLVIGKLAIDHTWGYLPEVEEQAAALRELPPLEQRVLSDGELNMLTNTERIAYLKSVSYDTNKYIPTCAWALHRLKRKHSEAFDEQAQSLYQEMLRLMVSEIS